MADLATVSGLLAVVPVILCCGLPLLALWFLGRRGEPADRW